MVSIVICYQKGTDKILNACLASIERHTKYNYRILILTAKSDPPLESLAFKYNATIGENPSLMDNHNVHGALLDWGVLLYSEDYILTLDSDCFPVADGWLTDLVKMMENGAKISGILHPWGPPPEDMERTKIEWRVRSQHCWDSTHVACQLIRPADLIELGKMYNEGDDTGMAILLEARKRGWKIDGFKPTRCPVLLVPRPVFEIDRCVREDKKSDKNPEFNRYSSVVFGDRVYHHGGFSRATMGDDRPYGDELEWVTPIILDQAGAEFLLSGDTSYEYKFENEDAVAQEKMERLFCYKGRNLR